MVADPCIRVGRLRTAAQDPARYEAQCVGAMRGLLRSSAPCVNWFGLPRACERFARI
jgi:hypothetical protein